MKKIKLSTIKELFQYNEGINDFMKFHEEVNIYNPFTFMVFSTITLLVVGFFKREAFIMAISLMAYMLLQFMKLKRTAKGLFLKREAPKKTRENEVINLKYYIDNRSSIKQKDYILLDNFTGSQKGSLNLKSPKVLEANTKNILQYKLPTDGGMGEHQAFGLTVLIQDSLRLFKISIEETKEQAIEVFPSLEPIPLLDYRFDSLSYHFGEKDIPNRGDSINFYGTRQYRPGDPIKKINWRLSAKYGETIVNIFEKNINKSLTILLNRDSRLHSGLGSQSTIEYLKDFVLAIASQNISNGNEVEFISNGIKSPLGGGQEFINRLEFFLYELNCIEDPKAAQLVESTIQRFRDWEGQDRSLIYLTPIVPGPLFEKNMEQLIALKERQREVEVVFVNAFSFIDQRLKFGGPLSVKNQLAMVLKMEEQWKMKLRLKDIPCYSLKVDPSTSFSKQVQKAKEKMWLA